MLNTNEAAIRAMHDAVIETVSCMGRDSNLMHDDIVEGVGQAAKEDFFQGYGDQFKNLDKKEQGKIFNIGKEVVPLLKEYL